MEVPDQRLPAATFENLALPLFDQLYNFAHWLTQDRAEAEDLVQETYAKALRGFATFQPGTNFRAWIFRILRNSFLTTRAGLKATVGFDEEQHTDAATRNVSAEENLIEQSNHEMVQQALERLPVPFREILLFYEVEEMSYQETANTLGVPIGTVMSRLSRARKALRADLLKQLKEGRHGM